ncbi:hypothetical protein FACS1894206_06180 [Deltaproteobacteria bacterium]|nr:hypothetical protein FACS1894206_06180 [Deltaproteobacteria bacterium]
MLSDSIIPEMRPHPDKVRSYGCISLIGMAASGKTTIGRKLAACIGWPHVDTDYLIEAFYGAKLQRITDTLTKEAFLDVETRVIQSLSVANAVVSTGGALFIARQAWIS